MTDETVDLSAAQDFTYGDLTLHAEDGVFTLSKDEKSIVLEGEVSTQTKGTPRGMFTQTVLTVKGAEDEETLAAWMPAVWADSKAIVLKQDGSFVPDLDMDKALVDYFAQSSANADSVTGYSTIFTVEDAEHAYESVWAYGTVIIENVFAIPGVGRYMTDAINSRDYPVVMGGVLILGLIFSLIMLLVDIVYAFVDPRIKAQYEGRKGKK